MKVTVSLKIWYVKLATWLLSNTSQGWQSLHSLCFNFRICIINIVPLLQQNIVWFCSHVNGKQILIPLIETKGHLNQSQHSLIMLISFFKKTFWLSQITSVHIAELYHRILAAPDFVFSHSNVPNITKFHYMLAANIDIYLAKTCKYLDLATSICFRLEINLWRFFL